LGRIRYCGFWVKTDLILDFFGSKADFIKFHKNYEKTLLEMGGIDWDL
jgi:hypothetical protein